MVDSSFTDSIYTELDSGSSSLFFAALRLCVRISLAKAQSRKEIKTMPFQKAYQK